MVESLPLHGTAVYSTCIAMSGPNILVFLSETVAYQLSRLPIAVAVALPELCVETNMEPGRLQCWSLYLRSSMSIADRVYRLYQQCRRQLYRRHAPMAIKVPEPFCLLAKEDCGESLWDAAYFSQGAWYFILGCRLGAADPVFGASMT